MKNNIKQFTIKGTYGYVEAKGPELKGSEMPEGMMNNKLINEGKTYISWALIILSIKLIIMNWKKNQVELKYYAHNSNLKLWEAWLELQVYRSDWRTLLKLGHCSAYILSESTKNERVQSSK